MEERDLLEKIRELIKLKRYRIRIHAVRHMIEEGFTEENLLEAITSTGKILESYEGESRCLMVGYFLMSERNRSALHIVCDHSNETLLDIVTAYIPQKPWWITPTRRGRTT